MKNSAVKAAPGSRKLRFGGYATLVLVAALAVVIAVNLLVDRIPFRLDLTRNRIFSLSTETTQVLDALKHDITITTIGKPGQEDPAVLEVLRRYAARNGRVRLTTVDPETNPGLMKKYDPTGQGIATGALVVAKGDKFKLIGAYDLYDWSSYNPNNPSSQPVQTGLTIEQRVTSAILYVTAAKNTTLAVLTGHGEQTLDSIALTTTVQKANYAVQALSLLTTPAVPADIDVLVVVAPSTDLTATDADKVRAYLAKGGKMLALFDVMDRDNQLPNFAGLLKSYGVEVRAVVVGEGDQSKIYPGNPYLFTPTLEYHDINTPLRDGGYTVALYAGQSVETLALKKGTLKIEPLLTSSPSSWGRREITKNTGGERTSTDLPGPFTMAVAITDPAQDGSGNDTKIIVVGDAQFMSPTLQQLAPANADFFMNCVGWLKGSKDAITIRAKDIQQIRLNISQTALNVWGAVTVILVPLLILGAGIVVWVRRRHL